MKNLFLIFLIGIFYSCDTYYQVIETSSNQLKTDGKQWVFDTTDVKISYDFWSEGSVMRFNFYNKRSSPIFIDLSRSHLIVNERSIDYYSENIVTLSHSAKTTVPIYWDWIESRENQGSISYKMKRIIEIPPHSYITVDNLKILSTYIADCKLMPEYGKINSQDYSIENSPFLFSNLITYSLTESFSSSVTVTNNFWVSNIATMYPGDFGGNKIVRDCFGQHYKFTTIYKEPQNFYFNIHK